MNVLPSPGPAPDLDRAAVRLGDRERRRQAQADPLVRVRAGRCGRRRTARTAVPGPRAEIPGPSSVTVQRVVPSGDWLTATPMRPSGGANRCAFETRLTRACSSRRWSPNTRTRRAGRLEVDRLAALTGQRAGSMATAASASSVASNWRSWRRIAPSPEASQVEDVADQSLHPLGVALDRLEHRRLLLGRWARGRIEEQPGARADDRERRSQLVGDRRQQVGAEALQVLRARPRSRRRVRSR